jgi:hypothetical protein
MPAAGTKRNNVRKNILKASQCGTPNVMRKLPYILMLGVAIGVVAPTAPAAASVSAPVSGLAPSVELVAGSGTLGQFFDPTVRVNVFQFATVTIGESVITYPDGTFVAGRATCLFVSGQTAYITSQIVFSRGPMVQPRAMFRGNWVVIGIQADQPGSPGPDLLNFSSGMAGNPGCGPNGNATPAFPIVSGDYRVFGPLM